MDIISWDTETHLVQPGLLAPPLVCASWAMENGGGILTKADAITVFRDILESPNILAGANLAYDVAVMLAEDPSLWDTVVAKYDRGEVHDVLIAQALDAVANGHLGKMPNGDAMRMPGDTKARSRYSLKLVTWLVLGDEDAKKNDRWRLRYAMLEGIPLARWPEDARQYAIDDAINTFRVARTQRVTHENLHCLTHECQTALALHLGACWGLRVDSDAVHALEERWLKTTAKDADTLSKLNLLVDGKQNIREVKRRLARAHGACTSGCTCMGTGKMKSEKTGNPVICRECDGTGLDLIDARNMARTPTGGISAGRDELLNSGDDHLVSLAEHLESDKIGSTYLPFLRTGVGRPISLRPNVLVESGRCSYNDVVQQLPREGGVRECLVPRPGHVLCAADYAAGELVAWAQVCLNILGESKMAEVINASGNPGMLHTAFAAILLGCSTEEAVSRIASDDETAKRYRQAAKAANFGFPGGMGAAKLVIAKRKKSEGRTTAPDGRVYPGIRFCLLLGGKQKCGTKLITEWKRNRCAPICADCADVAEDLRRLWFQTWEEAKDYFDWVSGCIETTGKIRSQGWGMVRGGLKFTNGANHSFQNLIACCAKRALWLAVKECYAVPTSPLYGSRIIAFMHDELIAEVLEDRAHEAAGRLAGAMLESAAEYMPDVRSRCEPVLMRRWTKEAKPVIRGGHLIPWEDA